MVSLPELTSYSQDDHLRAKAFSPAFARYSSLLNTCPRESLHAVRHQAWLKCVLATFAGHVSAETVCAYWSAVADDLLARTWQECGLDDRQVSLFALGKHGARELNLSSDIDLLVVSDDPEPFVVEKGLRKFQHRLQSPSEFGFCFRLDFDLRPGGQMGPLITSVSQFQDHYWSQGETWERLALVRLRPLLGPPRITEQICELAKRFSYRKFLDFTLLDDLKALRNKVHQKSFQRQEHQLNMKLEVGGIRDIELFVHALLILNGGKIPELQTVSTTEALQLLREKKILPEKEADTLLTTYWDYRQIENGIQSIDDRQTHNLTEPTIALLPPMAEVQQRMQVVNQIVSSLLGEVDSDVVHLPPDLATQAIWLENLGFAQASIERTWPCLMNATALSHKNDRDERARQEFLFTFVEELARNSSLDQNLGLNLLLDFVRATRAKATFFTMLLRSPRLIQDLARLFCLSPYLGAIVASRPELLDHFILQLDEAWSPDLETLLQQMSERKLLTELWAANQFLTDRDLPAMFERISETADSIVTRLLQQLKSEFPQARLEIITLGKWAGLEMGLRSDLDFIFVTPEAPNEDDFKVARRLISRLSDTSRGGNLYDLDLRLRPSGQSGPLLVAWNKLLEYWEKEAQVWERQAYLRARALKPGQSLPKSLLLTKPLTQEDLIELKRIRTKLLRPITADALDLKYAPGGLIEIEFVVQTAVLQTQHATAASNTLEMMQSLAAHYANWATHYQALNRCYFYLREFEQMLQLTSAMKTAEARRESSAFQQTARLLRLKPEDAWAALNTRLAESRELLAGLDPLADLSGWPSSC